MRSDVLMVTGALLVALLVVSSSVSSVGSGIVRVADELTHGTFRPFGKPLGGDGGGGGSLGGITGASGGGYVPGASAVPDSWNIDRDGTPLEVVIDYVFEPALGAMKRLKAFDTIGAAPDYRMGVADTDATVRAPRDVVRDDRFEGGFDVHLQSGIPVLIFAPGPDAVVTEYATDPPIEGNLRFLKDGADNHYVLSESHSGRVRLNLTYVTPSTYYRMPPYAGASVDDIPEDARPVVPDATRAAAALVLERAGVSFSRNATGVPVVRGDIAQVARTLQEYFLSFGEEPIPGDGVYPDTYLALALGKNGCCRHRAFAYALTMQAIGVPTRVVVNEAHAFAEVQLPRTGWHQVNLGGCGTYEVNNPDDRTPLNLDAGSPRGPDPGEPVEVAGTRVRITDYTESIAKARVTPFARGTVTVQPPQDLFPRVPVDVYLNGTSGSGRIVGTTFARGDGSFALAWNLPADTAPGPYTITAHAVAGRHDGVRVPGAWSDPMSVSVTSDTLLEIASPRDEGAFAPFTVTATLKDVTGRAVRGESVTLRVGENVIGEARTSPRGEAEWEVTLKEPGTYDVTVEYAGSAFLSAVERTVPLRIGPRAILLDADPGAARGHDLVLAGRVLDTGQPVADAQVVLEPGPLDVRERLTATTDADGLFRFVLPVAADAPIATHAIALTFGDGGYAKRVDVPVRAAAALTVTADEDAWTERPWPVRACVADDRETPVSGVPVAVRVPRDPGAAWFEGTTASNGCARIVLPAGALPVGEADAAVVFNGSANVAPAETRVQTRVAAGAPPVEVPAEAVLAIVIAVAGVTVIAVLAWQRRAAQRGDERGAWTALLVALRVRRPSRVHLAFPDLSDALADAWAREGPPLRVRAHVEARASRRGGPWHPVPDAFLRIHRNGAEIARVRTDATGHAETLVPVDGEGVVTVRAVFTGKRGSARAITSRTVRVVDYREEAERAYRLLIAVAGDAGAALSPASTPREVARVLAQWAAPTDAQDVTRAVSVFERVAFSEVPVSRADAALVARVLSRFRAALPGRTTP